MSLYYRAKIVASRKSSFPGEILVKKGDNVSPETIVLRTNYRMGRLCVLRVASIFDVPPENIAKYIPKKEGEHVKWSENVAIRTTFGGSKHIESPVDGMIEKIDPIWGVMIIREILESPDIPIVIDIKDRIGDVKDEIKKYILKKEGERVEYGTAVAGVKLMPHVPFYTKKVVSPCAGTITEIDYEKGRICIQKDLQKVDIKAHYWGLVNKIKPKYGVEIEFGGYVLEGAFGTGDIAWGKLVRNMEDAKGNVLLLDYLYSKDIKKIADYQPSGIIVGSLDYEGIKSLIDLHITAIMLEGFGKLQLDEDHKDFLEQSLGRNIVIKAATQVRAGVIRPQIIIPSDDEFYTHKKVKEKVRIIWGQHYGKKGVTKGSPYYAEASSGIKTWLCDVLCDDGKIAAVPLSNVHPMK